MAPSDVMAATNATSTDALLRALSRPGGPAPVEARLRRYMVERGLHPGDRLPSESDLAAALGSSRVVVREALRSLEAVGLVESRAGAGWFLRAFEVSQAARTFARSLAYHPMALLDLLAVRRFTEAGIVAGLAGKLSQADLQALETLVDRMRWRAARGERFPEEDGDFHRRIVAASGNLVSLALNELFWGVMAALYQRGLPGPNQDEQPAVVEAHSNVVAALRAGDG